MSRIGVLIALLVSTSGAWSHEAKNLDDLLSGWGIDLAETEVTSQEVAPGLHALFGAGGNVVVSIGEQGVLMVDSQFPELVPRLQAKVRELGGGGIDFVINTHWHFDHADGNPALGRDGSWMISHLNSRRMMLNAYPIDLVSVLYDQPPYPQEGLPVLTYDERMQMFFNGERIDLMHFSAAHTTGDTAVIFRGSNVVHMGDVFNASYPFIDVGNGGDLDGMIRFIGATLAELNSESIVVPGHGPVLGYADMQDFLDMLKTTRARLATLIDQGYSLQQVKDAKPTEAFDDRYGNPALYVDRAYHSLARQ
ncbi:MAG: MBL fold metallo-hydrolase [Gammaproteobacteria bacterium]|nr:MBL fold metallo-hydrolase [Gammaproteobacteria bacterium]